MVSWRGVSDLNEEVPTFIFLLFAVHVFVSHSPIECAIRDWFRSPDRAKISGENRKCPPPTYFLASLIPRLSRNTKPTCTLPPGKCTLFSFPKSFSNGEVDRDIVCVLSPLPRHPSNDLSLKKRSGMTHLTTEEGDLFSSASRERDYPHFFHSDYSVIDNPRER